MLGKYRDSPELDMNCIPGLLHQSKDVPWLSGFADFRPAIVARLAALLALALNAACSAPASEALAAGPVTDRIYAVDYRITPDISRGGAHVELEVAQNQRLLREMSMPLDRNTISEVVGDGEIAINGERLRWIPPTDGGRLRWFAGINHLRSTDGYDAYIDDDWALFRAEDVIPPTATRTLKGSVSRTTLMFDLPDGWTAVTEYFRRSNAFSISNPDRRFDRPTGWIVLGKLGVRHETIAGIRVVVAAPVEVRLLPGFPKRLTIAIAGAPMWRGGLSAPASFYVHADRPLISENGTSTIMHEMMHIGLGASAVKGSDWIIEGLAEFYGLEILRRSGTISEKRYRTARSKLADWGKSVDSLCPDPSTGPVTARAVTLLAKLDVEILGKSDRKYGLDDALRSMADFRGKTSIREFRRIVAELTGSESKVLSDKDLNGCEN
jgi:hypothetical protein